MKISLGHSPDPDDAFMFYEIQKNRTQNGKYEFQHIIQDIETLNQRAFLQDIDVTAMSVHAYAYLSDKYDILYCGASVGDGYGPIVVAKSGSDTSLKGKKIAIPGKLTTAFLVLKLYEPEFEYIEVPFDAVFDYVKSGQADYGLVIHEGQLTFHQHGLDKIIDLGYWWTDKEQVPLPLGINTIKKSFDLNIKKEVQEILYKSIENGLKNRTEALNYALQFGRGIDNCIGDSFVKMYVNDYTLSLGEKGVQAIKRLLLKAFEHKIISHVPECSFINPNYDLVQNV